MNGGSAASRIRYIVEYENRPEYFFVHIKSGNPDLETSREIVQMAAEELDRSGHDKVLALLDLEERLSFADNFWLISEFPEFGLQDRILAVVDTNPEHELHNHFADAAAAHFEILRRGFTSVEEAEEWLASQ